LPDESATTAFGFAPAAKGDPVTSLSDPVVGSMAYADRVPAPLMLFAT